ncbi:hypothetical protein Goshw_020162 [Gossypium schwendimanii]|uniref:Uncharacterized protein n=1 Tax=Gossypium schwendimanii TaxID=34291 RepID=A0A7J9MYX0_GOSSC|nr:hypothetical protein [Gossypium schwendimanii]
MLKKCPRKSALKEKLVDKALCPSKSVIEGNDGADNEPKNLVQTREKPKPKGQSGEKRSE